MLFPTWHLNASGFSAIKHLSLISLSTSSKTRFERKSMKSSQSLTPDWSDNIEITCLIIEGQSLVKSDVFSQISVGCLLNQLDLVSLKLGIQV